MKWEKSVYQIDCVTGRRVDTQINGTQSRNNKETNMTTGFLFYKRATSIQWKKMPIQQMLLEKLENAGEYERN